MPVGTFGKTFCKATWPAGAWQDRRVTADTIQAAALMGVTLGRPLTYYRGIEAMVGKRPF
ncbi:hypothetical protein CSZ94_04805 [Janthinobacterium sp. ROICE36]|uniref:hypothetical protein n=1 Tax=Janthinobacterium sp. ROICE36 TaxID=2048670 RepID=UPI000C7EE6F0|nr:hypothetical protein [Janthinobacterium sp. ROICE36]PLY45367.1 hypothetical protein CSZ94_04805 [Janthinobacterium sp. ROICE36]